MALLVRFKKPDSVLEPTEKAIYLSQKFYEAIFLSSEKNSILRNISRLDYGDLIEIQYSSLGLLKDDLNAMNNNQLIEISKFINVIEVSISSEYNLLISGDMHPVLKENWWKF